MFYVASMTSKIIRRIDRRVIFAHGGVKKYFLLYFFKLKYLSLPLSFTVMLVIPANSQELMYSGEIIYFETWNFMPSNPLDGAGGVLESSSSQLVATALGKPKCSELSPWQRRYRACVEDDQDKENFSISDNLINRNYGSGIEAQNFAVPEAIEAPGSFSIVAPKLNEAYLFQCKNGTYCLGSIASAETVSKP